MPTMHLFQVAVVACALLPHALGSMLRPIVDADDALTMSIPRNLEAQEYMAAMSPPTIYCYVENGFDFAGNDLANAPGAVETCCLKCAAQAGCKAWTWTDYNGGTCWLKSARGDIIVNPKAKSALFFAGSGRYFCELKFDTDFVGNDIGNVKSAGPEECCEFCHNFPGCRAYSWSDYNGGTCWLKSKSGPAVQKPGVKSAEAYPIPDVVTPTCAPEYDTDYVSYDIGNRPSSTSDGCCKICELVVGCRAWSWTNQNGGTCWLKNYTGDKIQKPGVVSATLYANPLPLCSPQEDTDYVGNDLSNVASPDPLRCCSICRVLPGCGAMSWSNYNGGTCWFKTSKGATATKAGVTSAVV